MGKMVIWYSDAGIFEAKDKHVLHGWRFSRMLDALKNAANSEGKPGVLSKSEAKRFQDEFLPQYYSVKPYEASVTAFWDWEDAQLRNQRVMDFFNSFSHRDLKKLMRAVHRSQDKMEGVGIMEVYFKRHPKDADRIIFKGIALYLTWDDQLMRNKS